MHLVTHETVHRMTASDHLLFDLCKWRGAAHVRVQERKRKERERRRQRGRERELRPVSLEG